MALSQLRMATWEMSNTPQGTAVLSLVHGMLGVLNSIYLYFQHKMQLLDIKEYLVMVKTKYVIVYPHYHR